MVEDSNQQNYQDILKNLFNISTPVRISTQGPDGRKFYNEYMVSPILRVSKLAQLGEYSEDSFSPAMLTAKRYYAGVGSNIYADPSRSAKLSNEQVKVNLAKSFFYNPEGYVTDIVKKIVNDISETYSLSEDEKKMLLEKSKNRERSELINFTNQKIAKGDEKLVNGIKTINYLMDILEKSEKHQFNKQDEFSQQSMGVLRRYMKENVFDKLNIDDKIVKDRLMYEAVIGNKKEIEKILNKQNYENMHEDEINKLTQDIITHAKAVAKVSDTLKEGLYQGSEINNNIKFKEQLSRIYDAKTEVDKLINKVSKERKFPKRQFQETIRDAKLNLIGNAGSFTGIVSDLKSSEDENARKTGKDLEDLLRKPKQDESYLQKLSNTLDKAINFKINSDLTDEMKKFGLDKDTQKTIIDNYKDFALKYNDIFRNISKVGSSAQQRVDDLSKELERENFLAILKEKGGKLEGKEAKELFDKIYKKADENKDITFSNEIYGKVVEDAAEVMNLHNIMNNDNIKIAPDEVDGVLSQSIKSEGLRDSVKDFVKDIAKNKEIKVGEKKNITDRVSDLSGKLNHVRLTEMSEKLNFGLNKLFMSRQVLTNFRSCLSSSTIAKTSVETLASTTAQCAEKLLNDIRTDINRTQQLSRMSGQGLAAALPLTIFTALREEVLRQIERGAIKEQNKFNEMVTEMLQKINTASSEIEKEARLELIDNEHQGGISSTVLPISQSKSYREAINREVLAKELAESKDIKKSVDEIVKEAGIDPENLKEKLTDEEKKALADTIANGLNNKQNSKDEVLDEVDKTHINVNNKSGSENSINKENILLNEINKGVKNNNNLDLNTKIKIYEITLEKLHKKQLSITRDYLQQGDMSKNTTNRFKNMISDLENKKNVVREALIEATLISMKNNPKVSAIQPIEKIDNALKNFKKAIGKDEFNFNGQKIDKKDVNTIDKVKKRGLTKLEKENIFSDTLSYLQNGNEFTQEVFNTLRVTSQASIIESEHDDKGMSVFHTTTGEKAYIAQIFKENERYLQAKDGFDNERKMAYNAMVEIMEGTTYNKDIKTFDDYIETFDKMVEINLGESDKKIKSVQRMDFIGSKIEDIKREYSFRNSKMANKISDTGKNLKNKIKNMLGI